MLVLFNKHKMQKNYLKTRKINRVRSGLNDELLFFVQTNPNIYISMINCCIHFQCCSKYLYVPLPKVFLRSSSKFDDILNVWFNNNVNTATVE